MATYNERLIELEAALERLLAPPEPTGVTPLVQQPTAKSVDGIRGYVDIPFDAQGNVIMPERKVQTDMWGRSVVESDYEYGLRTQHLSPENVRAAKIRLHMATSQPEPLDSAAKVQALREKVYARLGLSNAPNPFDAKNMQAAGGGVVMPVKPPKSVG